MAQRSPFAVVSKCSAQKPRRRSAWRKAQEEGIDMSLLEDSLLKTPEERIRANNRALATAQALREAMEKQHGRS